MNPFFALRAKPQNREQALQADQYHIAPGVNGENQVAPWTTLRNLQPNGHACPLLAAITRNHGVTQAEATG